MNKMYFWNNFSRYLTIGLSALILLVASQQMVLGNVFQRDPNSVLAEEDNCLEPTEFGCPEPGDGGQLPPPPPPPPPPAPQACPFEFKYNECIACNTSQPVKQDCNGVFRVGPAQPDSTCANWCAAPPPPAGPQAVTTCKGEKTIDQLRRELELAGFPGPWDIGSMIAAFNRAACPAAPPPPPGVQPPPPVVQPPPAPPVTITITQPHTQTQTQSTGAVTQTVTVPATTREVVREVQVVSAGNVGVGATAGQVLAVKELPKTGLPALAWIAAAFIPAGFRLRRLGKVKEDASSHPMYLWEDRQFKTGS